MKPTRRDAARFLLSIPASGYLFSADGTALFRYADPATEFPITRLTDPSYTSVPAAFYNRGISKHNFMLYSSDVSGRFEVLRMDLKTGQTKQLTECEALHPGSVTLLAEDRGFCFLDGERMMQAAMSGAKARELYRAAEGFELSAMSVAEDGLYAAVVERKSGKSRLQLVHALKGGAVKLAECDEEMRDPIARPRRASVLYRRENAVWLANYDGAHDYRLKLAEGETGQAQWSPDGRTVLYLNYPVDRAQLHNLREFTPDTNDDKMLGPTTQFVGFGSNADASVFVGASGSKASPHVLLLVRSVKRELTLAEHKASDPRMVTPVFSPTSQRVFFSSDRHGKQAIYTMGVDKLVEKTEA